VLQEQHSLSGPRPGESTSWVQVPHGTLHPGLSPVAKSSGQAAAPVMRATLPRLRETPQGVTVKRRSEVPAEAQDSSLSASPFTALCGCDKGPTSKLPSISKHSGRGDQLVTHP
jgi:hypothetical protein